MRRVVSKRPLPTVGEGHHTQLREIGMPRHHWVAKKQSNLKPAKAVTNCKAVADCDAILSFIVKDVFSGKVPELEIGERNIRANGPISLLNYKAHHRMSIKNNATGKYHKLLLTAPPA